MPWGIRGSQEPLHLSRPSSKQFLRVHWLWAATRPPVAYSEGRRQSPRRFVRTCSPGCTEKGGVTNDGWIDVGPSPCGERLRGALGTHPGGRAAQAALRLLLGPHQRVG